MDINSYLAKREFKSLEKVLHDCLFDLTLGVIVLAFYL